MEGWARRELEWCPYFYYRDSSDWRHDGGSGLQGGDGAWACLSIRIYPEESEARLGGTWERGFVEQAEEPSACGEEEGGRCACH